MYVYSHMAGVFVMTTVNLGMFTMHVYPTGESHERTLLHTPNGHLKVTAITQVL